MKEILNGVLKLWECRQERKRKTQLFIETYGLRLIEKRETSIILGCFNLRPSKLSKGKFDLMDSDGNILDSNLNEYDFFKKIEHYENEAKKAGLTVSEYLKKLVTKRNRKKILIQNIDDLGAQVNKVAFKLVDEAGEEIGVLTRSVDKKRRVIYKFEQIKNIDDFVCETFLLHQGMAKEFRVPVLAGENIMYADLYVPPFLTDKYSGFLKIMLDDSLKFFKNNKKLPDVDGNFGVWMESDLIYKDFGGKSVNLTKFWEARNKGMSIEEAAFETPTGKWAKENGFTKVVVDNPSRDIKLNKVIIKFRK